ncbi:MAG: hypothetical protein QM729_14640 [Solirubrobacterales bacterium]
MGIVGAGNGDDLPLRRITRRAASVTLIDIDPLAARGARRRLGRAERREVEVIVHDVTEGAADAIALAAVDDPGEDVARGASGQVGPAPLPGAPYDLVLGDLFYSQLLYPALLDLGVEPALRDATLAGRGPSLTRAVVARLHASAPRVVHLHDPLAWWDGHEQPFALDEILDLAATEGADAALALAARGNGPHESDPRAALDDLGLSPAATALWRWPFAPGVDYLACATLVKSSA